jgi:hypothetical protein
VILHESLTLRPKPRALAFGCSLAGTVAALNLGLTGFTPGWALAALLLVPAVLLGIDIHPRSSRLLLTSEGLSVTRRFRTWECPWTAISTIGVTKSGWGKVVTLDFQPGLGLPAWRRRANRLRTGHDAVLAGDYGMSADALAVLLKRWQARATGPPAN